MTALWLDLKLFGSGKGLAAPSWDQSFHWLVDQNTHRGDLYTFGGGLGAQLTSFQWTHPRPQEERYLAGMRFRPFQSYRTCGRVKVSWALQIGRQLRPEDFTLIKRRLGDGMAYTSTWGQRTGETR